MRARAAAAPPRPSLPLTLGCALGLWAFCALILSLAEGWAREACLAVGGVAVLGSLAAAAGLWRGRASQLWACLLGATLGVACACGWAAAQHELAAAAQGASGTWRLEAVEDGRQGSFGPSCVMRAVADDGRAFLVRASFDEGASVPRYGEVFEATASLEEPGESSAAYFWREGIVAEARVQEARKVERGGVVGALVAARSAAIDVIAGAGEGDGPAVLAALVCGWRGMLDEGDAYGAYQASGLAHLVAVSGAHLSIVAACSMAVLRLARVPRAAACAIEGGLLLSYLVLSGAPVSAVRAAVMAVAGMLSFAARRRPAALGALSVCIIGCVSLSPTTALSVSFALSALSTLGIVLFAGLIASWVESAAPRVPRVVAEGLSLTFASSVMATPLSAAMFSQLPLVAPVANVVAGPLFPLVCSAGLAACVLCLAVPPLSPLLMPAATGAAGCMTGVVRALAAVPHASVPVSIPLSAALATSAGVAAALWLAWPRPRRRTLAAFAAASILAAACLVAVAPRLSGDEIVMLDVGQGDAFVVRSRGAAMLVDTGNQDRLLREALARHAVLRLDAVLVTHGDDDHMGSLASLRGVVEVDRVLVAEGVFSCGCEACERLLSDARSLVGADGVVGLSQGDALRVGAFSLEVVWPAAFTEEGGNADSVCLLADADVDGDGARDWRTLFTGDAERDELRALIDAGLVGAVDVYKVGHHGSKNALDDEVAAVLSPRIALVSAGANNRYGHPAPETLERLEAVGATVRRTDEEGDVSCRFGPDRIEVSALR